MKILKNLLPLLAIIMASAGVGLMTPETSTAVPVSDEVAAEIRGGGCGQNFIRAPLICDGLVFCEEVETECSSVRNYFNPIDNEGNSVEDQKETIFCHACTTSSTTCGSFQTVVTKTKACSISSY